MVIWLTEFEVSVSFATGKAFRDVLPKFLDTETSKNGHWNFEKLSVKLRTFHFQSAWNITVIASLDAVKA